MSRANAKIVEKIFVCARIVLLSVGIGQICPIPTAFSGRRRDEKTRGVFLSFFIALASVRLFWLSLGQIFRC